MPTPSLMSLLEPSATELINLDQLHPSTTGEMPPTYRQERIQSIIEEALRIVGRLDRGPANIDGGHGSPSSHEMSPSGQ